jgi:hypothetical protein
MRKFDRAERRIYWCLATSYGFLGTYLWLAKEMGWL